jgi:hypothetical protein
MDSFTAMAKRITKTHRLSLMVGLAHKTAEHGLAKPQFPDPNFMFLDRRLAAFVFGGNARAIVRTAAPQQR